MIELVRVLYRAHARERRRMRQQRLIGIVRSAVERSRPHVEVALHHAAHKVHRYHWHVELGYLVSVLGHLRAFEQVTVSTLAVFAVLHILTDWT